MHARFGLLEADWASSFRLKVRRGGIGTHFVIHKYFYERDTSWQQIREEENKAEAEASTKTQPSAEDGDSLEISTASLEFEPMDSRHLSSLPLLRSRIVKLLKASKNHIHQSNNILTTLVRISRFSSSSLNHSTGLCESH